MFDISNVNYDSPKPVVENNDFLVKISLGFNRLLDAAKATNNFKSMLRADREAYCRKAIKMYSRLVGDEIRRVLKTDPNNVRSEYFKILSQFLEMFVSFDVVAGCV